MIKYIIKDMTEALHYLPCGLIVGVIAAFFLHVLNITRRKKGRKPLSIWALTCLFVYMAIIFGITFWSRESGSRNKIDMELFATWGINARNNAFVIENVLLFIPYGFLMAWNIKGVRNLFTSLLVGLFSSLCIETMQLLTERGYFQVDDILTNTLGMLLGTCLFHVVCRWRKMT